MAAPAPSVRLWLAADVRFQRRVGSAPLEEAHLPEDQTDDGQQQQARQHGDDDHPDGRAALLGLTGQLRVGYRLRLHIQIHADTHTHTRQRRQTSGAAAAAHHSSGAIGRFGGGGELWGSDLPGSIKGNNPPLSFFSKTLSIIFTIQFFILFSETLIISQTKSWVSQNNRKVKKRV